MNNDEWQTPDWLFNQLNDEFHFTYDYACIKSNCKVKEQQEANIWTETGERITEAFFDYLITRYRRSVFCNPPYSDPALFINACKALSLKGIALVCVLVLPASTDTKWWGIFWDYEKHCPKPGVEVRFLPKRVAFVNPKTGLETKGNTKGTAIVIMRPVS